MRTKRVNGVLRILGAAAVVAGLGLIGGCAEGQAKRIKAESMAQRQATRVTIGSIERLDPAMDAIVSKDAVIEVLSDGFAWTEGPVWINKDGGYLLFTDIPNNAIHKWSERKGLELYLRPAGYTGATPRGNELGANGLLLDKAGNLVLCQHGDRRVARHAGMGQYVTLADRYDGKRFNSPNDAVYKSNGDLYFTDPPYGLEKQAEDPAREMDYCGVYRLGTDGKVTLLTDKMTRPNGIAFSPDEKTLYVAQSDPKAAIWMAYDVKADGTIANGRVLFDATKWVGARPGLPDGLKLDQGGTIFATGPGGVLVFSPGGKHLGTIATGDKTANCAFGDDGRTLYMTVNHRLCRVRLNVKGKGF